ITGETKTTIKEGMSFDPLSGMSATDREDGNLTESLKIIENTVDSKKPGTYKVKYEVMDNDGNTVTLERVVIVVLDEDQLVKSAKQAIDQLFTDSSQAQFSHNFTTIKKGAIHIHVEQQHITEAMKKLSDIPDENKEKAALQKEIERAQKLLKERETGQEGNLVQNSLFDSGLDKWKSWIGFGATTPKVQADGGKSTNVIKIGPNSSVEQVLNGLEPNTIYELTTYAKTEENEKFSIGTKNTGTANVSLAISSKEYNQAKLLFKTGSDTTTATIYLYKPGGTGSGYADVVIAKKSMGR
ncbi:immunoglobulin-like domain-containing protein, partial [Bacillus cereus]